MNDDAERSGAEWSGCDWLRDVDDEHLMKPNYTSRLVTQQATSTTSHSTATLMMINDQLK